MLVERPGKINTAKTGQYGAYAPVLYLSALLKLRVVGLRKTLSITHLHEIMRMYSRMGRIDI
jgi:hypothetical protein